MKQRWVFWGILVVYAAVLGVAALWPYNSVAAQGWDRLQRHGALELQADVTGYYKGSVSAVCDTGNGTMLYIILPLNSSASPVVKMLPNGCKKAFAEKESGR